jgi:glycosyltransferase involved in cell wall biosynthesis
MWSGIPYHISLFLEDQFGKENVHCICVPLKRNLFSYIKGFYVNRVQKKNYLSDFDTRVLAASRKAFSAVRKANYDLIITFNFFIIPNIKTERNRVILWTDATFQNLLNFYQYVSNLPQSHIGPIHALQKKSLQLSDTIIFSSQWAADSAVQYYQTTAAKIKLLPFISNLTSYPRPDEIDAIIRRRTQNKLKLLFLGVDWERKGGDEAVQVLNQLNAKGIATELYIVGTTVPEKYTATKGIVPIGFINKNIADGEEKLKVLLAECALLLLPTMADCTPVAFNEANSFAMPVITTNVGGIASIVKNGINGYCFSYENFVGDAVAAIANAWSSAETYSKLCHDSYHYYTNELSLPVITEKFNNIIESTLNPAVT